jgi:hypothetical protein
MIEKLFAALGGTGAIALMLFLSLGELYWLWMAFKIGSFWMFVIGIAPPFMVVASLVGAYGLIFELPHWVYGIFG